MKKFMAFIAALALAVPMAGFAMTSQEMEQEIGALRDKVEKLEKKKTRPARQVVKISGDYQFRFDSIEASVADYWAFDPETAAWIGAGMVGMPPASSMKSGYDVENKDLMTNRFGLNLEARATRDITVKARLLMYKVWGHQTSGPVTGYYFADHMTGMDGSASHVPEDSVLRVDRAFATYSGVGGAPVWFSVGRRPSTGGVPTNLRQNQERSGAAGTPGILVDYAFDGMVLGVAPDMEALPGAYAKLCYGKGFDSGLQPTTSSLKDVKMVGLDVAAYSTDGLHVEVQYNRAYDIFAMPEQAGGNVNLGDIEQLGAVVMGKAGPVNLFASAGMSKTHPNDNMYSVYADWDGDPATADTAMPMAGLLYDNPMMGGKKESRTGNAIYVGARYDAESIKTKIGAEYNKGSEYWITFTPAADDMLTSKLATRGQVVEFYVIKELDQKPISPNGRAYIRLGYQDYEFDYTGSGNWVGAPVKIDEANTAPQMFIPVKEASNIYLTFNVEF